MRVFCLLLVVLGVVACQKQAAPQSADAALGALPAEVTPTLGGLDPQAEFAEMRARSMPAVNARVPPALREKLKFAPQFDAHNRVLTLVPDAWVMGDAPGKLMPGPEGQLGASTSMAFGSACDGRCAVKDWAASFDKVEVRTLPAQEFETDEVIGQTGRVVVARSGAVRYVVAGLWKPDSARYFFCRATLEGPAVDALSAFVAACRAMEVHRWE